MKRCPHPKDQLRACKRGSVSGELIAVRQCLECGRRVGPRLKYPISQELIGMLPWFDYSKAEMPRGNSSRRNFRARFQAQDWRGKGGLRERCFRLHGKDCFNCGEEATEAHHLSYRYFGDGGQLELNDLRPSCKDCNTTEREGRIMKAVWG